MGAVLMWVWINGEDEPRNLYIPIDAPSSTGEFDDLRQEVAVYWNATERFGATGDDSQLDYFTGAYLILDSDDRVKDTDTMQHDADGAIVLDPGDRLVTFQLDQELIEEAINEGELDFDDIESGGGA
jgi:hypothetical protein